MLKTNTKTCTNNNKHSKSNGLAGIQSRTTTTRTTKRILMSTMSAITQTTRPPTTVATVATTVTNSTTTTTTAHRKNRINRDVRWRWRMGTATMSFGGAAMSLLLFLLLTAHTIHATAVDNETQQRNGHIEAAATKYSQPLTTNTDDDDDSFRPIIPKDYNPEYISRNVFTESGQYRVFQPVESDLRRAVVLTAGRKGHTNDADAAEVLDSNRGEAREATQATTTTRTTKSTRKPNEPERKQTKALNIKVMATQLGNPSTTHGNVGAIARKNAEDKSTTTVGLNEILHESPETASPSSSSSRRPSSSDALTSELKGLEALLVEYVEHFFQRGQYEPLPGLLLELQKNHSGIVGDGSAPTSLGRYVRHVAEEGSVSVNIPRALQTGRLFFVAGLKKLVWPIMMGLNVLKSLLLAMFLPTIIGSFSKLIGKGITSGSAPLFIRPMDAPQDLDFKDNTFNFEEDNKFVVNDEASKDGNYAYNQPEASQTQQQYAYNTVGGGSVGSINHQTLSRYGGEQQKMQDSYLSALQSISSASFKNSNSISGGSSGGLGGGGGGGGYAAPMRQKPAAVANMNTFQTFQKVPASSLLLSNYDPFYSPLLSRLDSVFAQLKLNSENEICREKLICLMYANPAKYAPYSNLVSAQLSRELNELRKPTSDNPDILRFFKYMRAAKDGQDGVDCEKTFDRCTEFKDFENPAMVSTYHDINKLVQARKMA